MKTSEILNRAADLIEERGWTNVHESRDPWGGGAGSTAPVCLEGGIAAAIGMKWENFADDEEEQLMSCPAYEAVRNYLGDRISSTYLYEFNDHRGRTAEEVIEVLRAAAVIEAAKESEPAKAEASA